MGIRQEQKRKLKHWHHPESKPSWDKGRVSRSIDVNQFFGEASQQEVLDVWKHGLE